MKKFITMAMVMLTVALTVSASPTRYISRMLTGTFLCVTNSLTVTAATSGAWYYSYSRGTNVQCSTAFTNTAPIVSAPLVADDMGKVSDNLAVQIIVAQYTNTFRPSWVSPVMRNLVWTNPVPVFTNASASTNTLTATFTRIGSVEFRDAVDNNATNINYVVSMNITNGVQGVLTAALPTAFTQGAEAITVSLAAGAGTGTGQGIVVNAVNLIGWKP